MGDRSVCGNCVVVVCWILLDLPQSLMQFVLSQLCMYPPLKAASADRWRFPIRRFFTFETILSRVLDHLRIVNLFLHFLPKVVKVVPFPAQ